MCTAMWAKLPIDMLESTPTIEIQLLHKDVTPIDIQLDQDVIKWNMYILVRIIKKRHLK